MNLIQIKQIDGLTASLNSLSNSIFELDESVSGSLGSYDTFWDQHQWDSSHVLLTSEGSSVGGYGGIALGITEGGLYVNGTGAFLDNVGFGGNVFATQVPGQIYFKDTRGQVKQLKGSIDPHYSGALTASEQLSASNYIVGVNSLTLSAESEITLPSVSSVDAGKEYIIKDEGFDASSFNINITGSGGESVDSGLGFTITGDGGFASVYSNGTSWFLANSSGVKI